MRSVGLRCPFQDTSVANSDTGAEIHSQFLPEFLGQFDHISTVVPVPATEAWKDRDRKDSNKALASAAIRARIGPRLPQSRGSGTIENSPLF